MMSCVNENNVYTIDELRFYIDIYLQYAPRRTIYNTLCCTRPRGITRMSVRTSFNAKRGNFHSSKLFLYVCADVSTRFYEFRISPSTVRPHEFHRSFSRRLLYRVFHDGVLDNAVLYATLYCVHSCEAICMKYTLLMSYVPWKGS